MNNSYTRLKRSVAVVFLTGLTLLGFGLGTAQAGKDWKTYPGSSCRPAKLDSPQVGYVMAGAIYNRSSFRGLLIYCPIIRDMMSGNAKWTQVGIFYKNPDPSKRIRCDMTNRGPDGRLLKNHYAYSSGTEGYMRIYSDGSGAGTAVYTLSCSLPKSLGTGGNPTIMLIHVREAD